MTGGGGGGGIRGALPTLGEAVSHEQGTPVTGGRGGSGLSGATPRTKASTQPYT